MDSEKVMADQRVDYVKLGAGVLVVILALFAMFRPPDPTGRVPVTIQTTMARTPMAVALQTQGGVVTPGGAVVPAAPVADQPFWVLALVGFAIGCYGTIVGIGGGPLILPILVFFYGWENELLVATSLFIVFLNALSGCAGYAMQKRIDYKGGIKFTLAAMPGAFISSYIHHLVNLTFFDIIFGIFLVFLAGYTFFSVGKLDKNAHEKQKQLKAAKAGGFRRVKFMDNFGIKYDYYSNDKLGISMNLLLGFFCGFLGIGGGVFQVPILIFLLYYPTHVATATSHFVTLLTCAVALLPHIFLGNVMYNEAGWMGVGVVVGAQVGARIASKLNTKVTLYLFIIILVVFAIKLFLR
ncbi:MAG: sulfite exporter TauE/SafE family protein [Candidatus Omnitrophica bacterium]|nr:sulfite exporter TauE/SafE family protein [Candidatus Omnitrophota bacterium]